MLRRLMVIAGAVAAISSAAEAADESTCRTVTGGTGSAQVCGSVVGSQGNVHRYLGVRYGTADVWRPSTRVDYAVNGTSQIDATAFGPKCLQADGKTGESALSCLNLNIWAPSNAQNLPVMFFIHGGAFIFGSNQDNMPAGVSGTTTYDGTWLAENKNVVVISTNYRLGALGFLPITLGEKNAVAVDAREFPSNFGIRDQQLAIQWAQDNATAFGGDPANIVIFGESAGAMSVGVHVTNPNLKTAMPGVKAAIMESNPLGVTYRDLKKPRIDRQNEAERFVKCLTSPTAGKCGGHGLEKKIEASYLDAEKVAVAQGVYLANDELGAIAALGVPGVLPFTPVIDSNYGLSLEQQVMPKQPTGVFRGSGTPIPLLYGYNHTEGVLFAEAADIELKKDIKIGKVVVKAHTPLLNRLSYGAIIGLTIDAKLGVELSAPAIDVKASHKPYRYNTPPKYSFGTKSDPGPKNDHMVSPAHASVVTALASALTDFGFACGNLDMKVGGSGSAPVWAYRLDQPPAVPVFAAAPLCDPTVPNQTNVCHISELPYVFNSLANSGFTGDANSVQQKTADLMSNAWGEFANNYASTGPGSDWKPWNSAQPMVNVINAGTFAGQSAADIASASNCKALWNQFLAPAVSE